MSTADWESKAIKLTGGRDRRLLHEWRTMGRRLSSRNDIRFSPSKFNARQLPTEYLVDYRIKSICGVTNIERLNEENVENEPIFHTGYQMTITLPDNYPDIDGAPRFRFRTTDDSGQPIPHPWHPNIRFFGDYAGNVCLNMADTYTDLAWAVERVALYLRYELFKADEQPPYPEDLNVAKWTRLQALPNRWVYFDQDKQEGHTT